MIKAMMLTQVDGYVYIQITLQNGDKEYIKLIDDDRRSLINSVYKSIQELMEQQGYINNSFKDLNKK